MGPDPVILGGPSLLSIMPFVGATDAASFFVSHVPIFFL